MKKLFFIALISGVVLFAGCAIYLTTDGAKIKPITELQKPDCEFISIISKSIWTSGSMKLDAENTMNQIRNEAALLGADSIYILHMASGPNGTVITAEALKCNN
jgi:hypothetical protein